MTKDSNGQVWIIRVSSRKGNYWPYTGNSTFLGSYDIHKNKGFVSGTGQDKAVSSLPVNGLDISGFSSASVKPSDLSRMQIELSFESAEEANAYIEKYLK